MPHFASRLSPPRRALVILLTLTILLLSLLLSFFLTQAGQAAPIAGCCRPTRFIVTNTPEAGFHKRICGRLVYLVDNDDATIRTTGLLPCSGGEPLIFDVHPRDNIPYFRFRDVTVEKGEKLCDVKYGCLDQHITAFQNYVGIDSCSACGVYGIPPTWTLAPLTPYTPTPVPPTSTPYVPSPTPTDTLTPTPGPVTDTPSIFEIIGGTPTTSATFIATQTATPTQAGTPPPTTNPNPSRSFPAVCGFGLAPLFLSLAWLLRIRR